ncbi:ShKT domain-containing protein [Aphelenchoides besseyi]|nr:ShKT domain-containing protein [Aphelenchoides besseyi]
MSTTTTESSTTETDFSTLEVTSQSTPEVIETTSTILNTPSTRRYGPRFLTPPSAPPRAWTPLSFSHNPTPSPPLLPPLVVSQNDGTTNSRLETTVVTNKPCRDLKYSCLFWVAAEPRSCVEQKRFMQTNCAFTCNYCIS